MRLITEDAVLKCAHGGTIRLKPVQDWVRIDKRVILIEGDLVPRPVIACPAASTIMPPCLSTVSVERTPSYSAFVSVDGLPVCMDTATGVTDWSKLNTAPYSVTVPGQQLVTIGG